MSDQELENVQQNKAPKAKRFILVNKDIASVHTSEVLLLSQFVSEDSPLLANLVLLKIDIKSKKCAISFIQANDRKTTGIKDTVPQLLAACDMFVGKLDLRDFPNNTLQARLLFVQNQINIIFNNNIIQIRNAPQYADNDEHMVIDGIDIGKFIAYDFQQIRSL